MSEEIRNTKYEIRNTKMDLDELLHEYFRSEMPQSWPAFAGLKIEDRGLRIEDREIKSLGLRFAPAESNVEEHDIASPIMPPALTTNGDPLSSILHPRSSSRSRLVLAASVALLFLGSWWLGQKLSTPERSMGPASTGKMIGSKPGKSSRTLPVR
ncbi:MAG TPA: hypothetical protein VGX70_05620 [Gemmataceae bacterium]|jgi:hypothetical protein|nr:hypothetical protein [Gemmataceae bacterium]